MYRSPSARTGSTQVWTTSTDVRRRCSQYASTPLPLISPLPILAPIERSCYNQAMNRYPRASATHHAPETRPPTARDPHLPRPRRPSFTRLPCRASVSGTMIESGFFICRSNIHRNNSCRDRPPVQFGTAARVPFRYPNGRHWGMMSMIGVTIRSCATSAPGRMIGGRMIDRMHRPHRRFSS